MSYKFHIDPGHGWIEVTRKELILLGIEDKISTYSYQNQTGDTIYLEEDCDAGRFIKAYETRNGVEPSIVEKVWDSVEFHNAEKSNPLIRRMASYCSRGGN